jgi:hypothetical protein
VSSLADFTAAYEPEVSGNVAWMEEPVPLTVFIRDRRYLAQPALSPDQYEAVRHAERIYYTVTYESLAQSSSREIREYWSEPCRMVNFLELEWGKGGGKDHTCRVISLRIAYLLLCLPSPQSYYGMPEQDTIHMLNVASNSRQASRAFFKPMRQMVSREDGWFYNQGVQAIEVSRERRHRNALGGGEAERMVLQDTIRFPKNVEAISGHSVADAQEGLNLILGIGDEIDAFPRDEELAKYHAGAARGESSRSAEAIVAMLRSSARTRYPEIFKNVHISWPRYVGSMIQVLRSDGEKDIEAKGEASRFFVSGPKASWEVNPRIQRACPDHQAYTIGCPKCWEQCRVLFEDDYEKDPARAKAMYEAKPSRAINPYFSNAMVLEQAFSQKAAPPLEIGYVREGQTWAPSYQFSPALQPIQGAQYAMHCDLALSADMAGIALAHIKHWEDRPATGQDAEGMDVEVWQTRPVVKVDFLAAYSADKRLQPVREIQIRWARLLCQELIRRGFNIRLFTCDGFESADSRQIMETQWGIETHVVSTDRASMIKASGISQGEALWRNVRDLASEARLLVPGSGIYYERCLNELLALSRMPNGKIDHPPGGCFTGETRVPLLEGREAQIRELAGPDGIAGSPVWVYASDDYGRPVPALARGRRTKQVRQVCDVILRTGAVVRCTPEHLWRMWDGSYREAQSLRPGDRLMPLYRKWDFNSGYEQVWGWDGQREWTHKMVCAYFSGGSLGTDEVAHHENEVKTDNRPENLKRMGRIEHLSHHTRKRHAEDESYVSSLRRAQRAYWESPEAKDAQRQVLAEGAAYRAREAKFRQLHADRLDLLRTVRDAASVGAAARRVGLHRNSAVAVLKAAGYESWGDFRERDGQNHRVRLVELVELDEPVWVYDLEVDAHHNFALTAGVFVHNSKDIADSLAGACGGAIYLGGREDEEGTQAYPGSGLEEWSGSPVGGIDGLPIGFQVPDAHRYHEPIEQNHVEIDGIGRPAFAGGFDYGDVPDHQP